MNAAMVRKIFDSALALETGQALKISVEDKAHALSFRTMFYRERKKLLDRGLSTNVVISEIEELPEETVVTVMAKPQNKITFVDSDGSETSVSLDFGIEPEKGKPLIVDIDPEKERLIKAMYEDQTSKEEIVGYFDYHCPLSEDEKVLIDKLFKNRQ